MAVDALAIQGARASVAKELVMQVEHLIFFCIEEFKEPVMFIN